MLETYFVTTLISKELIAKTIGETSTSIYNSLNDIYNQNEFNHILDELDIKSKIDIVNSLMKTVDKKKKISDVLHKSLNYLHEIIDKINLEIKDISKEIEEHKHKYFYYLRTPSYNTKVNNLVKHSDILNKRLDLLIKLINIDDKI